MNVFFYKQVDSTEAVSDRYISVNNFGYCEDVTDMRIHRPNGRLDYQLIYLKHGELLVESKGREYALAAGDICLFRPGEAQIYRSGGRPTTYFWIHFTGREPERMLSFFQKQWYSVGVFPEFEYYCRGFQHEPAVHPETAELLYEGRLIALFARIAEKIYTDEKKNGNRAKIFPALNAMRTAPQNRLSNDELCRLCGLSRDYFLKVFRNVMGTTPQQYYVTLTIDRSCYLLTNTAYTISEIARLCGIEDSLYFSRMFKKHTGLSPRSYRNAE